MWGYSWMGQSDWWSRGLMLAMIALLITLVVLAAVAVARNRRAVEPESEALSILKRRYASGEIQKEEYDRMVKLVR
jgi:uncharacterized membrane protein